MPVQRRGLDLELLGHAAHREVGQPVVPEDPQRGLHQILDVEGGGRGGTRHGHRIP
ncbi:hypothetical protein ACFFX0_15500 [Citricoccus parietis]|uniref:Uncharacterized protein n=1 Tax=Citricoccus parietis TaxID=592307 RepID=A0ABV5G0S7_9MICC